MLSSVAGFMANTAVYSYALKAFDLDPATESHSKIMRVLKSDPSDPKSYARRLGDERYVRLAAAFNFDDKGRMASQRLPQTEANQIATANRYADLLGDNPSKAAHAKAKSETTDYKAALSSVATINDFVTNDTILTYALKAYGLDQEKLSKDDLKAILTSDLGDPESFANAKNDNRYDPIRGGLHLHYRTARSSAACRRSRPPATSDPDPGLLSAADAGTGSRATTTRGRAWRSISGAWRPN